MPAALRIAAPLRAAVERTELTFTSWNIRGCHPGAPFDAAAVAEVLLRTGADVIALQEAGAMGGGVHQAAAVAALLGMQHVYGPNVARLDGRWRCGNAILSRFPVLENTNHDLSVGGDVEPRGCLVAHLEMPSGETLVAASAHLGLRHGERARQATRLASLVAAQMHPLVLGADANDWFPGRDTRTLRGSLTDAWTSSGEGARATYPATLPMFRLDHVYVREPDVQVRHCETAASGLVRSASDHVPVVARVAVDFSASG